MQIHLACGKWCRQYDYANISRCGAVQTKTTCKIRGRPKPQRDAAGRRARSTFPANADRNAASIIAIVRPRAVVFADSVLDEYPP